jgi:hypothetical protein
MGIVDGLLGHATEVNAEKLTRELAPVLIEGEVVEQAFKVIRDLFVFTNKRLVLVDKQGLSGKKVEYHSIPYQSIRHFAVETAGRFDRDAELKIWLAGVNYPVEKELKKGTDVVGVQKTLARHVLK